MEETLVSVQHMYNYAIDLQNLHLGFLHESHIGAVCGLILTYKQYGGRLDDHSQHNCCFALAEIGSCVQIPLYTVSKQTNDHGRRFPKELHVS